MRTLLLLAGLLFIGFTKASAVKITIIAKDVEFTPAAVFLNLGDTVMFLWAGGDHTTTSTSVPAGAMTWDSPLTSSQQTFTYVPAKVGEYAYLCTPHALMNMKGTFTVKFPVGISNTANNAAFVIMPNPARTSFTINYKYMQDAGTIELVNMIGKTILTAPVNNAMNTTINVAQLPAGVYMVRAKSGNTTYVQRVIVE